MIYVLGDSHAWKFRDNPAFDVRGIAGLTAHGFAYKDRTGSAVFDECVLGVSDCGRNHYSDILRDFEDGDSILFVLGEVDCRVQFFYHHAVKGTSIDELVNNTINRYGTFLLNVPVPYAVLDVPPACLQGNAYGFEYYGNRHQRAFIARVFNEQLEKFCGEHGIRFIKTWSILADDHGFLKEEYAEPDEAHVKRDIVEFIEKELCG